MVSLLHFAGKNGLPRPMRNDVMRNEHLSSRQVLWPSAFLAWQKQAAQPVSCRKAQDIQDLWSLETWHHHSNSTVLRSMLPRCTWRCTHCHSSPIAFSAAHALVLSAIRVIVLPPHISMCLDVWVTIPGMKSYRRSLQRPRAEGNMD